MDEKKIFVLELNFFFSHLSQWAVYRFERRSFYGKSAAAIAQVERRLPEFEHSSGLYSRLQVLVASASAGAYPGR